MRSEQQADTNPAVQPTARGAESVNDLDPRLLRVCCGNRIAPQLAEIRRPDEAVVFVTVWPCPHCKRITY
ncbi:MAG: hypothetical protein M1453_01380 [Acidobacteria bacterium]|nr:hypothetical protein [Acidobacteriota bacterium]MCL5286633.1 hypothetical protein [Acidobacteriota bacterium]